MDKWVLITGASQGIGYEFAKLFAADGHHLVLVARDEARLTQIAGELRGRHNIQVKSLAKDLNSTTAAREIFDELQRAQIFVSILVNNAGIGAQGRFEEVELQRHLDLLQVNVTTLTQLTHLFLKPMVARREGRIVNVASIASFVTGPFMSTYYASKAYVHSFSHVLAGELAGSGVTVTAVYPGLTRSQFHERAGMDRPESFTVMTAEAVARIGYRGLMRGRLMVVTGGWNRVFVFALRFMPMWLTRWLLTKRNRARLNQKN